MYLKVKLSNGQVIRYNRDEAMTKYWRVRMELDRAINEDNAQWAKTLKAMLKRFEHYFERRNNVEDPSFIERRKKRVEKVGYDDGLEETKLIKESKPYNGTTTVRRIG